MHACANVILVNLWGGWAGGGRRRQDLNRCIDKIELVDYHQVLEHEGIKFWCYNAGHVLGAAMFMIEIAVR